MAAYALHAQLGLVRNPFPPTPDAECYYFTEHLQAQLSELAHCIEARKGFMLLTGEVGLGKSTLVRRLMETLPAAQTRTALVLNTFLQGADLLASILRDFGVTPTGSLDADICLLNDFLLARRADGITCLLIVDDAQNLDLATLELIRLLCNLETTQEKLLQILLVGQSELEATLALPSMRQLQSRIVKHVRLCELTRHEVARYFDYRTNAAGAAGRITLQKAALRALHVATGGNVRRIHLVLDRCLYGLSAAGTGTIDAGLMRAALADVALPSAVVRRGRLRSPPRTLALAALLGVVTVAAGAAWVRQDAPGPGPASAIAIAGSDVVALPPARPASDPAAGNPGALNPAAAPALAPVAFAQTKGGTPTDSNACLTSLAALGPLSREEVSIRAADHLRGLPGLCVEERDDSEWIVWKDQRQANEPVIFQRSNPQSILTLQRNLAKRGLLQNEEQDGLYGSRTAIALARFQAANELPIGAEPDALTLMLLDRP